MERAQAWWPQTTDLGEIHLGIDEETLEVRAVEATSSEVGDGLMLPELLVQIPADQDIASVTADGNFDARKGHDRVTYIPSERVIRLFLTQFDCGELKAEEADARFIAEYAARIAALKRKVDQLTMEPDLAKKHHRCRPRTAARGLGSPSARCLLHQAGAQSHEPAAQHLLLPLDRPGS